MRGAKTAWLTWLFALGGFVVVGVNLPYQFYLQKALVGQQTEMAQGLEEMAQSTREFAVRTDGFGKIAAVLEKMDQGASRIETHLVAANERLEKADRLQQTMLRMLVKLDQEIEKLNANLQPVVTRYAGVREGLGETEGIMRSASAGVERLLDGLRKSHRLLLGVDKAIPGK